MPTEKRKRTPSPIEAGGIFRYIIRHGIHQACQSYGDSCSTGGGYAMSGWSIYILTALKGIDAAEIIRRHALSLFEDRTEITWTLKADRIGNLFNFHVSGGTEIIFCHLIQQRIEKYY